MREVTVPRTPSPPARTTKPAYTSPPPAVSSHLTPPPTNEIPRHSTHFIVTDNEDSHGDMSPSPNPDPVARNGRLPTVEEAKKLSGSECRELILQLLPTIGETRMALAHTQLQLNLLSIESNEAAQRAEVEHDMTRREVEVLRAGSPIIRGRAPLLHDPRSAVGQIQRQLELAVDSKRGLEAENIRLQRRLKQAKKVIKHLNGKSTQLLEDNHLLRERIKQNRNHIDAIRATDPQLLGLSPASAHQTPSRARAMKPEGSHTPGQTALDALLMADQILSADLSSVPATPSPFRAVRQTPGHVRGTQSLSSLPTTPTRTRPMTANEVQRTPVNQIISTSQLSYSAPTRQHNIERSRTDRDSTISASEEEALTDEDVPASQASQAASSMLRRFPANSPDYGQKSDSQRERGFVQSRINSRISKPKVAQNGGKRKRVSDGDDAGAVNERKKARVAKSGESLGLGIGVWSSPRR